MTLPSAPPPAGTNAALSPHTPSHATLADLADAERVIPPSPIRRVIGVARIVLGLVILTAIITQIVDTLTFDVFRPARYFAYFTIQSNLLNVVVLVVGGIFALRVHRDTRLLTSIRMSVVVYATVTGVVYALLLRGLPPTGYEGPAWPNEVLHVWAPILIGIDWLFSPGRRRLGWRALWIVVAYPIVWLVFTIPKGIVTGWFPYPFLDPNGAAGWAGVAEYSAGISAFIVALGAVAILTTRLSRATRPPLVMRSPRELR